MPVTCTARCSADVAGLAQHSVKTLATSTPIALPSIFAPVSPRPVHRTPMIPSTAVIDRDTMMMLSRNFRVGHFMDITFLGRNFSYSDHKDHRAAAPEHAYSVPYAPKTRSR